VKNGVGTGQKKEKCVPAGKAKFVSTGNAKVEFAYEKYQSHPLWPVVEKAIRDLQVNQDIDLTTAPGYVVGYLVNKIINAKEARGKRTGLRAKKR
jgi:hypothetical protein